MPTLFILFGFRFSFFANDHLPIHIHAIKGKIYAKIQVLPKVELIENKGLTASELKKVIGVVEENKDIIIERWNDFFNTK